MQRELFETDIGELPLLFGYDESWSQAFAFANSIGTTVKGTGSAQNLTGVRSSIPVYC